MKNIKRIFLDANIYIAALASPSGPSGRLIKRAVENQFTIVTANFLLLEVERNLKKKLPESLPYFYEDISRINFEFISKIKPEVVNKYEQIINYKPDSLVLAACFQSRSKILVTLDKKHLLKDEVRNSVPFEIIRPENILRKVEKKIRVPKIIPPLRSFLFQV